MIYYQTWKQLCCLILWNRFYFFRIHWFQKTFKRTAFIQSIFSNHRHHYYHFLSIQHFCWM